MNKNQRIINFLAIFAIVAITVVWLFQGAEIFTKTKILVDNTSELDKMLGVKNEVWVDKFILGLDYSAAAIGFIIIITIALNYLLKTKRKES
jgi:hypothetical protein